MSTSGIVTLSDLIDQVRQESDQVNSQFVTDLEVVTYINNSYKELYDLLVGAYGEDYYVAKRASFVTDGNLDMYPLPDGVLTFTDDNNNPFIAPPFYKLLGLDYQLSPNNPQGYITLKTFPFSERNRFSVPNFASFWGFTNLRYRLTGNNLWLTPIPAAGQPLRLYYIPRPVNLLSQMVATSAISTEIVTITDLLTPQVGMQFFGPGVSSNTAITAVNVTPPTFTAVFSSAASTITVSSATGLVVGQSLTDVTAQGSLLPNTTITSIVGTTVGISNPTQGTSTTDSILVNPYITLSAPVSNSTINGVFKMFSYTQTVDGISGWEEFIVIDGAGKIMAKEESDVTVLGVRKDAMIKRIEGIAANRDPGSAAKTADVATGNLWDGGGEGNNGFGGGWY